MSRPVHADAQATRRQILQSSRDQFARLGLAGASVRSIARDAGVSLAMVHHYFGSKERLYAACVDAMLEDLAGLARELTTSFAEIDAAAASLPRELIERAVRIGWRFGRENRHSVLLLQRSIVDAGEVDADIRERRMLPFLEVMSTRLAAVTGRRPESLRLAVQSAIFLVVRYAIASDRELSDIAVGASAAGEAKDAAARVEDHLVETILGMLLGV